VGSSGPQFARSVRPDPDAEAVMVGGFPGGADQARDA